MNELFSFIFAVINSVLLAGYYADFLTPRGRNFTRRTLLACFGAAYFIIQYIIHFLISFTTNGV